MRLWLLCLCLIALPLARASTATLEGTLSFERSPRVALVYFPEDVGLQPAELVIDQKDKAFSVPLVAGALGSRLVFRNSDSIQHNVYADDQRAGVSFDIGLAEPGVAKGAQITWKTGEVARCGCKIHPRMQLWVASITSRYHQVVVFPDSVPEGQPAVATITIANVPEGLRQVRVWMPKLDQQNLTLVTGQPAEAVYRHKEQVLGTLTLRLK